jgi:hypothetical protein
VLKTAAVVVAFLSLMLLPTISRAQLLPSGNVYVGVSYGDTVDVVNRYTVRGWNASVEEIPLPRFSYLGVVLDGSGFYRKGLQQYNALLGPRVSKNFGKWRVFAQVMGGAQRTTSGGMTHYPVVEDGGVGVDHKFHLLFMKNFSWRAQFDYDRSRLLTATQNDFRGSTGLVWRF